MSLLPAIHSFRTSHFIIHPLHSSPTHPPFPAVGVEEATVQWQPAPPHPPPTSGQSVSVHMTLVKILHFPGFWLLDFTQ